MNKASDAYPDNWVIRPVSQLVEFLDGKRIPLKQEDRALMKGNIPYYGASGIIDFVNDYIFDDELILLGEDGENVVSRNLPLAFKINGKSWVNNHAHVLKPKEGYNIDFLTIRFEFQDYKPSISGSAQPKIPQGILAKLEFCLPNLEEQQKIAKILTAIDQLIEKTQALIDKHTAIKQGMMADLFTRGIDLTTGQLRPPVEQAPHLYKETELGWIPKDWDVDLIDNVLERVIDYRGKTPTKTETGIPLITAKNIRMGFVDHEPREYIAENAYDDWMTRGIPIAGDVLFTTEAPLANVAQIETNDKSAFAQRVIILRCNNRMINDFLKYTLMSNDVRKRIFRRGSGSTVEGIKQSQFRKIEISFPVDIKEQTLINKMLNKIKSEINNESKYQYKLVKVKNGLMQDLLTGKVAV